MTGQRLVCVTSVKIHAQEYVELMRDVKFKTISPFAFVLMVIKEMHLLNVDLDHHHQKYYQFEEIHANLHHVDLTVNVGLTTIRPFALV